MFPTHAAVLTFLSLCAPAPGNAAVSASPDGAIVAEAIPGPRLSIAARLELLRVELSLEPPQLTAIRTLLEEEEIARALDTSHQPPSSRALRRPVRRTARSTPPKRAPYLIDAPGTHPALLGLRLTTADALLHLLHPSQLPVFQELAGPGGVSRLQSLATLRRTLYKLRPAPRRGKGARGGSGGGKRGGGRKR